MTTLHLISLALMLVVVLAISSLTQQVNGSKVVVWPGGADDGTSKEQGGEKVDRMTSATGDLIWPSTPGQLEWLLLQQMPQQQQQQQQQLHLQSPRSNQFVTGGGDNQDNSPAVGLDGPMMRSYHDDLVDEFKQYARGLVNPSRESRAFKPKLMSTARGFGKRAYPSNRITYSDLLEAANPNSQALQSHGKMSEAALR